MSSLRWRKLLPGILRGWQHNDSVLQTTRAEVNVEVVTLLHVSCGVSRVHGSQPRSSRMHKSRLMYSRAPTQKELEQANV